MIRNIIIASLIYALFSSGQAKGTGPVLGIPSVQNYSTRDYRQHEQNWAAAQDCTGIMYFGNSHGLLEYDGTTWHFIRTVTPDIVRSLAVSDSNTVYIGGYNYFGRLGVNQDGEPAFQSLSDKLDPSCVPFGNVWRIDITSHGVYFGTDSSIICWSGDTCTVKKLAYPSSYSFVIRDTLYMVEKDIGLVYMTDDTPVPILGGNRFDGTKIYSMIPFGTDKILIGTRAEGLFIGSYKQVIHWDTEVNSFCIGSRISEMAVLRDGTLAVGSTRDGMVIMDQDGRILFRINKDNGLPDNTVWNLFPDNQGGLWLTLNNGISRVTIPATLTDFNQHCGLEGTVESIVRHRGVLYVATPTGIFYLDPETSSFKFRRIPGFQPYKLASGPVSLMATGYEEGVFELIAGRMIRINTYSANFLHRSIRDPNRIFIVLEDGLSSLYYNRNRWIDEGRISLDILPVLYLAETGNGDLWLRSNGQRFCRVRVDGSSFSPGNAVVDYFETGKGLQPADQNLVFEFNGDILVSNGNRLLKYDEEQERFLRYEPFAGLFPDTSTSVHRLVCDQTGAVWMLTSGAQGYSVGVASPLEDGSYFWDPVPYYPLAGSFFYTLYPDPEYQDIVWLGGPDGLFRFDRSVKKEYRLKYPCLIRKIITQQDSVLLDRGHYVFLTEPIIEHPEPLSYRYNGLRFEFSAPFYESEDANEFQYILEGFDEQWSAWSPEKKATYTNIPEGSYRFRVHARNIYRQGSGEAVFAFRILPPWYRSWWAYILYVLLFSAVLIALVKFRSRHLEREKQALEQLVTERTAEIQLKNRQLAEQAEKLKELDHLKSSFFANISHEFRTPLTLIIGPVEEMLLDIFKGDPKQIYKVILRNAKRLLRLINQLLDLSTLESGKMKLQAAKQHISPLLKAIIYSFSSLAEHKHIQLQYIDDTQDIEIFFDRDKLEKIMYNLISNAFKFTPKHGVITIKLENYVSEHQKYPEGAVLIRIQDTGIGISKEDQNHIFSRFTQGSQSAGHHQGGSGIGLALVKELVLLHHGDISMKSEQRIGTEFNVILPKGNLHLHEDEIVDNPEISEESGALLDLELAGLPLNHFENDPEPEFAGNEGIDILVVEDNTDVRMFICGHFRGTYNVLEAENGRQGIDIAREHLPDLIISDVMMPETDGIELCNTLKNDPLTNHIPIILLTAKATDEAKIEGLETGADAYLVKPFNARELSVRVKSLIEGRQKLREKFKREFMLEPADVETLSFEDSFLKKVHDLIEDHLSDPAFSAELLHSSFSLSRRQFHRKIQALTDQSPGQLIRTMRLKRAMQLIKGKVGSISEIAFQVGFNNLSYFSKCFSEQFGKLPSEVSSNGA